MHKIIRTGRVREQGWRVGWRKGPGFRSWTVGRRMQEGSARSQAFADVGRCPGETKPRRRVSRVASCLPLRAAAATGKYCSKGRDPGYLGERNSGSLCADPRQARHPGHVCPVCRKRDKSYPHPQRVRSRSET